MSTSFSATLLASALRRELLRLARAEDERAADEAAKVPYWAGYPPSVQGRRAAAAILRADADSFLTGADYASWPRSQTETPSTEVRVNPDRTTHEPRRTG